MTGVLARAVFRRRTWSRLTELAIFAAALALFYAVLAIGRTWLGPFTPSAEISASPRALPGYAAYSVFQGAGEPGPDGVESAFSLDKFDDFVIEERSVGANSHFS